MHQWIANEKNMINSVIIAPVTDLGVRSNYMYWKVYYSEMSRSFEKTPNPGVNPTETDPEATETLCIFASETRIS